MKARNKLTSAVGSTVLSKTLSISSLLVFLFGPFIAHIIAVETQPHDGSGAAWAPVGLINGMFSLGLSSFIGAVLGVMANKNDPSLMAKISMILNGVIALPMAFICAVLLFVFIIQ